LIDNGDKTASIEISDVVVVGVHSDIIITVSDGTDSDAETISITIEAAPINNAPVLATIGNQTMNTGEILTINITATDADSEPLTISATSLPSFAEFTDIGDGTATIVLTPVLGDEGAYADVVISVTDGTDAASETITITVDKVLGISDELTFRTEVYPNPVSGNSLNVNLSKFDVSKPVMIMITDASGKVMLNKSFNGSEQVEINEIGSLQNGVYILNLKQADKQSFIRFIIER
ncbi:MAG: T9SS type A sorting domain-containing protein, partial [Bacteroidota bacterium]